jgi:ribonuclease HII|tara:strand:+ start:468 stop:1064 length:597 start_codon:yes stop_codon:yes gene_type:complete
MSLKRFSDLTEVGCDEAGRGALCGPVIAAAVILPKDFKNEDLNDSKKISLKKRNELSKIIHQEAIACEIGIIEANEIDKINILNASIKAMHKALDKIKINFDIILVDGPHFKNYKDFQHECVVRGDSKYLAIAAASIIAKTYRDELMFKLHEKYPEYKWCRNKGYPTSDHRSAIHKYGINNYHRKSFKLIDNQTSLNI